MVIKILQLKQSEAWRQAQMARIKEADRKRSESQAGIPKEEKKQERAVSHDTGRSDSYTRERDTIAQARLRTDKGTFEPGVLSRDKRPGDPEGWEHVHIAQ